MAATLQSARLTEAHRLGQARIGAETVRQLLSVWSLVDPNRLDDTIPAWLRVALPLIQNQRTRSSQLAGTYLRAQRLLELGPVASLFTPFTPILKTALDTSAAVTSLTVTGPVSLKRAMTAGSAVARAAETAQVNTARAGMRHAIGGGRDTITATVEADPIARGYRRVTSASPCDFCTGLASRNEVYGGSTRDFAAHDGCNCSSEPVYFDDSAGEARRVARFVRRDMTDQQRSESNARIRQWVDEIRAE